MGPTSTNSAQEQRELVKIHAHLATLRMFSIVSVCSNAPLGITTKLRTLPQIPPVWAPAPLDGSMTAFNCVLLPVPAATLGKPYPAITNVSRFVLTLLVIRTLETVHFLAPSRLMLTLMYAFVLKLVETPPVSCKLQSEMRIGRVWTGARAVSMGTLLLSNVPTTRWIVLMGISLIPAPECVKPIVLFLTKLLRIRRSSAGIIA